MSDIDLNSPEVKEAIKAAIEEATEGLASKNKELLAEVKELKRTTRTVNPEAMEKLETRIEELQGQLTNAEKAAKKAATDAEKAAKALADEQAQTNRLIVDNGLTDALTRANVTNPIHIKAVKAMLRDQVQVVPDGDQKIARVGDKPLSDYITEWAGSDEGKHFVTAPDVSGGGAQGNRNGGGAAKKTATRSEFDGWDHAQRAEFAKSGGTLTD